MNLTLSLAHSRDVDPGRFQVFARDEARFGAAGVRLFVIGASSLVIVEGPGASLAEIIACAGATSFPCLAGSSVAGTGSIAATAAATPRFRYQATLRSSPLGAEAPGDPLDRVLEHHFPGPGEPLTRIEAGLRDGLLLIRTRHDYPEHHLTVWSRSEWRFTAGR